jgi:hypothetical protein
MKKARLEYVMDARGELQKIVATDAVTGKHLVDVLWDPTDEHTEENLAEFEVWAKRMLKRLQFEVDAA